MIQKYITSNQMWSLVMALSNFCQIIPHLSLSHLVASNAAWCVWNSMGSKILARLMNLPMKRWTPFHCITFVPTSDNKVGDSGFLHSPLLSSLQIPHGHFIIICGAGSRLKCTYRMQPPPPCFHVWRIVGKFPTDEKFFYPAEDILLTTSQFIRVKSYTMSEEVNRSIRLGSRYSLLVWRNKISYLFRSLLSACSFVLWSIIVDIWHAHAACSDVCNVGRMDLQDLHASDCTCIHASDT